MHVSCCAIQENPLDKSIFAFDLQEEFPVVRPLCSTHTAPNACVFTCEPRKPTRQTHLRHRNLLYDLMIQLCNACTSSAPMAMQKQSRVQIISIFSFCSDAAHAWAVLGKPSCITHGVSSTEFGEDRDN